MEFFFISKNVPLNMSIERTTEGKIYNYIFNLLAPSEDYIKSNSVPFKNIYLSNGMHIMINKSLCDLGAPGLINMYTEQTKIAILSDSKAPKYIGNIVETGFEFIPLNQKLVQFENKENFKIAIFLSSALGDMLIAFKALKLFHNELFKYFNHIEIDLLLEDSLNYIQLIKQQDFIKNTIQLPVTLDDFCKYDAYIDLDTIINDERCKNTLKQPLIDMYLEHLSLDKTTISDSDKRNHVKINLHVEKTLKPILNNLKSNGKKLILFHTKSVLLRSIPISQIPDILDILTQNSDYKIISLVKIDYQNDGFVDLSDFSKDFDHFAYIISQMDGIITVDTSVYHIADCFDVPVIVLFTSINPDYRIKYYPFAEGILLGGNDNKILGKHLSCEEADLDYTASLFKEADWNFILNKLNNLISR